MSAHLSRRHLLLGTMALGTLGALGVTPGLSPAYAQSVVAPESFFITLPDGRQIPSYRYTPKGRIKGHLIFSHGAASAPRHYGPLIQNWVRQGYEVLAALHVDSVEHPQTNTYNANAWRHRIEDVRALARALDGKPYVMAGHSFGGLTSLAIGGAVGPAPAGITGALHDPNLLAVLAFSPPAKIPMLVGEEGYLPAKVPLYVQTGTKDSPQGQPPEAWEGHLDPYKAANAPAYGHVLDGVNHYFGGLIGRAVQGPAQQAQMERAVAASNLFLQAYGRKKKSAQKQLAAYAVPAGDQWLSK